MKQKQNLVNSGVISCIIISLLAGGCSQSFEKHPWNAKAVNMVPADFELAKKHPYNVSLCTSASGAVPGSSITELIWDDDIINAINYSLKKSRLFKEVTDSNAADYILCVTIVKYDQPWFGADLDIKLKMNWELRQVKTDSVAWRDTVDSTYRVKLFDAPVAAVRAQLATEGAVRENIKEGFKRLSQASI